MAKKSPNGRRKIQEAKNCNNIKKGRGNAIKHCGRLARSASHVNITSTMAGFVTSIRIRNDRNWLTSNIVTAFESSIGRYKFESQLHMIPKMMIKETTSYDLENLAMELQDPDSLLTSRISCRRASISNMKPSKNRSNVHTQKYIVTELQEQRLTRGLS